MKDEKLMDDLKNLKMGYEYQAKLAVEEQLDDRKKGYSDGEFYRGKHKAYKEAAEVLGKIIEETEKEQMPEGDVEKQ